MSNARIILGNRRFTCLSSTLIRIEFAPAGQFEDRRSMVAYPEQRPQPFASVGKDGAWDVLKTGQLEIRTTGNDVPCNRNNLEIRWLDGRVMQIWRPDDRDHQNLGGTMRSLDRYGGPSSVLDGVSPATMESPDINAMTWPAWIQCEIDPLYVDMHPNPPANFGRTHWLETAKAWRNDGSCTERTFNWYKESRKFCAGVLSLSGYFLLNDSLGAVLDSDDFPIERSVLGAQDWYFFGYGTDYQRALGDLRLLTGPSSLPRHKSVGLVFSRWPAFSEAEIRELATKFRENGYPLSTLVMDMEWHKEGWGHWELSPELIPDPKRFFALCREFGLEVTFNDHPLDVRDDDIHFQPYLDRAGPDVEVRVREYNGKKLRMAKVDITNKQQNKAFFSTCHTDLMKLGLDYWWNDGSRGQMIATSGQLVVNKSCFDESQRDGRRGMLLARYGGIGSHRYGAFFTGDTTSDFHVLKLQCEFNIRAGGIGLSNISHDLGGFCGGHHTKNAAGVQVIDAKLYLRWVQFGVFNPIMRFHCAPGSGSRQPFDYDDELKGACRRWLRVRHSILPYVYTGMRHHHDTGIPLVRGMYLADSRSAEAYRFDQFYFGPDMLVAPMLEDADKRSVYLPAGTWWEFDGQHRLPGGIEIVRPVALDEVPVYVRAGSIIPRQAPEAELHAAHIAELILDVYADGSADGSGELYEDDGVSTGYLSGKFVRSRFTLQQSASAITVAGAVAEGVPFGSQRQVTLRVHHLGAIRTAHLDGRGEVPLTAESPQVTVVRLPALPSAQGWSVRLDLG